LACQSVQVKGADLVIALLLAQTNKYEIFSGYLGAANLNKNAPTYQNITFQQKQHNKYQQHENHEAYYLPG
jgi:hypothetical protein